MFFAVLDRDVEKKTVRALPQLYETGLHDQEFNLPIFVAWILRGVVESCIIFFVCYGVIYEDIVSVDGTNTGLWAMGICAYTCVIFIVTAKLALYINDWTPHQAIIMAVSALLWFVLILIYGLFQTDDSSLYAVGSLILGWPAFWACVALALSSSGVALFGVSSMVSSRELPDCSVFATRY
jgi:phospholipid-translocating ATPase